MLKRHIPVQIETVAEEHDRLRAQRERIAAIYGHQPKQPTLSAKPAPRREIGRA